MEKKIIAEDPVPLHVEFNARWVTSARRAQSLEAGWWRGLSALARRPGHWAFRAGRWALGPLQRGRDQLCWVWPGSAVCGSYVLVRHSDPRFPGWLAGWLWAEAWGIELNELMASGPFLVLRGTCKWLGLFFVFISMSVLVSGATDCISVDL